MGVLLCTETLLVTVIMLRCGLIILGVAAISVLCGTIGGEDSSGLIAEESGGMLVRFVREAANTKKEKVRSRNKKEKRRNGRQKPKKENKQKKSKKNTRRANKKSKRPKKQGKKGRRQS